MVTVSVFLYVCVLLTHKVVVSTAYIPIATSSQSENNLQFQEETFLNTVSITYASLLHYFVYN